MPWGFDEEHQRRSGGASPLVPAEMTCVNSLTFAVRFGIDVDRKKLKLFLQEIYLLEV